VRVEIVGVRDGGSVEMPERFGNFSGSQQRCAQGILDGGITWAEF
jgi:hypothetical protein